MKKALLALVVVGLLSGRALGQATKYWDINGATAGAGGATPTGNWNTTTANWTTDGANGELAGVNWAAGDHAVFSAAGDATGVFTVTTTAAQSAGSITVEEGTVQHVGTTANSLTTSALTINNGATFSVSTASSFTPTAGSTLTLNGGTIQNRNGGVGSSFLSNGTANTNMKITLGTGGGHVSVTGASTAISIYTGLIGGTGPLFIDGTNNATFRLTTTPAIYTGATTITSGGKLQISTTANVLPAATDLTINTGGIFDFQAAQSIASLSGGGNMIGSNSAAILTITGASSTNYSGVWSGTSNRINVNKSGGTLTLSGVNTGTGRFTVTNGNVDVASTASIGGNVMDLHVDGGTLTLNQAAETVENLVGAGGSIVLNNAALSLVVDPIATSTSSSVISGAGGLTKVNVNSGATVRTQILAGNNTYGGNTFVNGGILSVQHANALGSTNGYTEVNQVGSVAAELLFTSAAGSVTTAEPLRISGAGASNNGAIAVTAGATPTISGPVTLIGNSTITVSGTSSVLYNNANAFTSAANQNLTLQGGAGTAPLGIGTISGAIALGTGSLTKSQGGKWVLSNAAGNTYSGGTIINSGTLLANNTTGSATGSGAITVVGGTFGGTGAVTGAVTVQTGGTLAPGASIESLDTGALTFEGGSNLNVEINSSASLTAAADLLNSSGGLTIAATAVLNISDASPAVPLPIGTKLTLVRYDATAGWNGVAFNVLPDDSTFLFGANEFLINYNDTTGGVNFVDYSAGAANALFVTLTAVPEASAFLFGGLACCVAGVVAYKRRRA